MKKICLLIILFSANKIFAQIIINRDPEISQMVNEISKDSLQSYIANLVAFGTRNTLSTQNNSKRGIGAARNWVLKKFNEFAKSSSGRLTAFIDTVTLHPNGKRIDRPILLGNVMATLKGTDPNDSRIFVISGHLDNMRTNVMDSTKDAPGADDDGSGTSAVLECARIMGTHSFPATLIFVAVSGEEQGLFGSTYMAEKAKKENWNIEAVLNNDIMGSNNSNETNIVDNTKVRVFSEGIPHYKTEEQLKRIMALGLENDSKSRQLARYVKETAERYVDHLNVVMIYRTDRFLRGGDHLPYLQNGFTAVRITEMNENFTRQHQDVRMENGIHYGDLPQHIDYTYLAKNTAMNLANLANLAKAPPVPEEVKIEITRLTNTTSLSWLPPKTGNTKGYFVLLRETTSPVWQKKIFTADDHIIIPYSKDNYFFAVQSVNSTGNESLPVVPDVGR
ncbi:M20/M25/M40 family metallo-hydrolase [Ginsengibacter hankyongi]|uniref:M20/M25/M40 family metallo-hydrolase n=1 Tax=Ginsengibacter hankyongi TaxID=2607284 RepID=A0A5J5IJS1_9BACT|nr:M20/M25/M40 family metallo-hydrolase [Ginsengibacter hankyongi]KAA9039472.1 M20/M25/M40 family metallo-hydrolase [Ginsengibacter hankyongi]